jgi:polyketide synthase PksN
MAKNIQTRKDILQMIENNQITPEEGFDLIQKYWHPADDQGDPAHEAGFEEPENPVAGELRGTQSGPIKAEIAIIGISGCFPGAKNVGEFWGNLAAGKCSITEIPKERWDFSEYYDPDPKKLDKTNSKWGGFLEDIDKFDPMFFNISGKEAELSDPQQRKFLEEGWKALEDAGYATGAVNNTKCGIFVGVCGSSDYLSKMQEEGIAYEAQAFWGNEGSILPARISYFLNLKGPSVAVNTACSSSLVAIHLGCQSIVTGESEMVIAGGVYISSLPNFYVMASNAEMLSPDGHCNAFDNDANGFVPGEGVGVVVLKSLEAALRDGDHIYGVIKGSGINQDGKTNGITAPSPLSQSELEASVYQKFGIDPETIDYIETHGTGTKLGDPIEIEALTNAFRRYTAEKQFCAVGSVKTNIGHAATAAGVAGVIKVLLSLKNKKIPPSLNFKRENEHINFKDSPFYVNTRLAEWKAENGQPRRATVSSFGFSGTNAHLVIEEAPLREFPNRSEKPGYLIPLSAKTEAALYHKIKDLGDWLNNEASSDSLGDISYTLWVGRSHFPVRLVLIARDLAELEKMIAEFQTQTPGDQYFLHNLKQARQKPDSALKQTGAGLINQLTAPGLGDNEYREKLRLLADLYLKGCDLEWERLFQDGEYRRISLPAYPFARERYWIPIAGNRAAGEKIAKLHPLLDRNISDLEEQKYAIRFTGKEFYLQDHVVGTEKVLPGVVYIEMARAAGAMAGKRKVGKIKNTVWASPIGLAGTEPKDVFISLYPDPGTVDYEIWTAETDGRRMVHAQGKLVFEGPESPDGVEIIDLDSIRNRCAQIFSGEECYRRFRENGFHYGPSFQTIKELRVGENEAVSLVELPAGLEKEFPEFILHPALMDAALQTATSLMVNQKDESGAVSLPYGLGEVEILRPLPEKCRVFATRVNNLALSGAPIAKYEIVIVDEGGQPVVKIKDFTTRAVRQPSKTDTQSVPGISETLFYRSVWEDRELKDQSDRLRLNEVLIFDTGDDFRTALKERSAKEGTGLRVVLVKPGSSFRELAEEVYEINPAAREDYQRLLAELDGKKCHPEKILHLWSRGDYTGNEATLQDQIGRGFYSVLYLSQALMERKPKDKIQLLYVFPGRGDTPQYAGVGGLAKTIRLENPKFLYRTVEIAPLKKNQTITVYLERLLREFLVGDGAEIEIRYDGERRQVKTLREWDGERAQGLQQPELPFKTGGVYLITGGAGGLGMIFAEYLAGKVKAKLILTDRAELSPEKAEQIREIEALGSEVIYLRADISERKSVVELIREVKTRFRTINGIIHAAGVIRDSFLLKKTAVEVKTVLAPKVYGAVWLDELTQEEPLDFFVMFSSNAAIFGNPGQCDYAYANSFMDGLAGVREKMRKNNQRSGKTLAINWPLWRDGGMKISAEMEQMLSVPNGLELLNKENGLGAFEAGLRSDNVQLSVFQGDRTSINNLVTKNDQKNSSDQEAVSRVPEKDEIQLREKIELYLKGVLAKEIRFPVAKILSHEPLEKYGMDSVMVMRLTRELESNLGELSKTLFFEYQTIAELAGYFIENHADKLLETGPGKPVTEKRQSETGQGRAETELRELSSLGRGRFLSASGIRKENDLNLEEIAIVGVSGRYPMADSVDEFWDRLKAGQDCVTEIPKERWDYRQDYDPNRNKPGKSYSKWGGFVNGADQFDPLFFNISPKEAEFMDPQERLFLETVWHTLEDAGYTRNSFERGRVGVFVGVMYGHYQLYGVEESRMKSGLIPNSYFASIANRVSYCFNFHGPSIALDTMCSSSLTAIHLACQSIRKGECAVAVAGGVNLSIHPHKYLLLSQGRFASSDGRCRSFGEGGDGYVPGEGVGAVLLKTLSQAKADGDHIYAVIKGSYINHGGKTNGYTVPNPNAQADVITDALKEAKLDPRKISYLEAHGTGTPLGDPIEITGLAKAYREYTKETQFCAIGSVKSNIGHLESAAGIAGITKILLQMKYKQLVPSIHSETLNPNIHFNDTPFTVQRELAEWKQPALIENGIEKTYPRLAGISSFGAGGANAHIILEEYQDLKADLDELDQTPQVVVISAKNEKRLQEYIRKMVAFLEKERSTTGSLSLTDIAYTLQVGREALEERLALVVASKQELLEKLNQSLAGKSNIENLYQGNIKGNQPRLDLIEGEAGAAFIKVIINNRELLKLAQLWVSGVEINWRLLSGDCTPRRVSLPTYPFAKERYWVPEPDHQFNLKNGRVAKLHPLIDSNISDLQEQKYTIHFTGNEFYLEDHKVGGKKVLPGVAYLEMARAAGELAAGQKVHRLKNIIWARPVIFDEDSAVEGFQDVGISLYWVGETVEFEVWLMDDRQKTICARGSLVYEAMPETVTGEHGNRNEPIDIAEVKKRCPVRKSGAECYRLFENANLTYGPSFRGIQELFANEKEAVALIELPSGLRENFAQFELHPLIMDGAFQTIIGLAGNQKEGHDTTSLPFALGEVEMIGPLTEKCYVYATPAVTPKTGADPLRKYQLLILDETGRVLVKMKDLTVREFQESVNATKESAAFLEREIIAEPSPDHETEILAILKRFKQGELEVNQANHLIEAACEK